MIKKIAAVALATVMVVAAQATYACDSAKTASATEGASCSSKVVKQASASGCCAKGAAKTASAANCAKGVAKTASAQSCTPAEAAACGSKKGFSNASAQYLCTQGRSEFAKLAPFGFMNDAKCTEVNVAVEQTSDGFALVFTGVNEGNVEQAMNLASQSMEALGKPAACEYTRASMVKAAGGCETTEACLTALANCNVTVIEIAGGAKTVISTDKADKVKELHGMLATAGVAPKVAGDSE